MKTQTRFLATSHAARILGCSAAWVLELFDRGVLAGERDSLGRRLLDADGVEKYRLEREKARRRRAPSETTR